MSYRTLPALILASLATFAAPHSADACGPPAPGLTSSIPADGGTYPSNGALFFSGFNIALTGVTVTVDGQPAAFGPAPAKVPTVTTLVATITPAPKAGQKVVIQGDFCEAPAQCTPKTITFTAGPPITGAPPVTDVVAFDVYDYVDYVSNGGDCSQSSDLAYWAELKGAAPGDSPRLYTISAYNDSTLQKLAFTRSGFISDADFRVEMRALAKDLAGKDPAEAFCFRAKSIDVAGNGTDSQLLVCKACRYRAETMPNTSLGPPPEPKWTSADIYPSGPCGGMGTSSSTGSAAGSGGSGSSGAGGDDTTIGGCSCQVGDGGAALPGLLSALALAAGSIARARRRRAGR